LIDLKQTLGELPQRKIDGGVFLLANMIYTDGLVTLFAFGGLSMPPAHSAGTPSRWQLRILLGRSRHLRRVARRQADDRLGPTGISGSLLILLLSVIAICWWTRIRSCSSGSPRRCQAAPRFPVGGGVPSGAGKFLIRRGPAARCRRPRARF